MPVWDENGLKGTYSKYRTRRVILLCAGIPEEQRPALLEKIQAGIVLEGLKPNQDILKLVTKHLNGKAKEGGK